MPPGPERRSGGGEVQPENRLPFDAASVRPIAAELGVPVRETAYRVHGAAVYELEVPCTALPGSRLLIILWPSLHRVDVRLLPPSGVRPVVALTRQGVVTIEIYRGIEVMFRRRPSGLLFVTRDGVAAAAD